MMERGACKGGSEAGVSRDVLHWLSSTMVRSIVPLSCLLLAAALAACANQREHDMCAPSAAAATKGKPIVLFAGQADAHELQTDSTHLYWFADAPGEGNQLALMRGPKDASSPPVRLIAGELAAFALDTNDVYVGEATAGNLLRVPKAGGKPTELFSGSRSSSFKQLIVDATAVFARIETPTRSSIVRIHKDGGAAKTLDTPGVNKLSGILADDTNLYFWTTGTAIFKADFTVVRMPKDGGPQAEVLRGPSHLVYRVALVDGWLFWASAYAIMKAPVGGGARSWLASTSACNFTVHPPHVYYVSSDQLFRAPLAGGTAELVAKFPYMVPVSDTRDLYFTDFVPNDRGFVGKWPK